MPASIAIQMTDFGNLLLTRARGKEVGESLPPKRQVVLDFAGIEVASPSFLDEMIKTAFGRGVRSIAFVHASAATQHSIQRLRSLRDESEADRLELVG